jgi:hypothetical protein
MLERYVNGSCSRLCQAVNTFEAVNKFLLKHAVGAVKGVLIVKAHCQMTRPITELQRVTIIIRADCHSLPEIRLITPLSAITYGVETRSTKRISKRASVITARRSHPFDSLASDKRRHLSDTLTMTAFLGAILAEDFSHLLVADGVRPVLVAEVAVLFTLLNDNH